MLVTGLLACGGEDAAPTSRRDVADVSVGAADPEALRPRATANPELSAEERALLLRARGRQWRPVSGDEVRAFLTDQSRPIRLLYVWTEPEGGEGLRAFQTAVSELTPSEVSAAVLLAASEVSDDAVVSLRSSQVPLPAFHARPGLPFFRGAPSTDAVLMASGDAGVDRARFVRFGEIAGLGEN